MTGKIFICGDSSQGALLDDVAATLFARGHQIVRGPDDTPGQVRSYSAEERAAYMGDVDVAVFTVRHECARAMMADAQKLRGVCYPVIGVETLDLEAAAELGIIVGHGAVRGNVVGMAEANVMLMLMMLYDVTTNIARMQSGEWRRPRHHGHQLEGKTVGLIGFGRIAHAVTERLRPFNVRILTYSPRANSEELPFGVEKVSLEVLLAHSDVVSVLTGLTPETRNLLNGDRLAQMKPTAFLINTGRGAVVDEIALAQALRENRVAGAAIDTFAVEPLPADSPLRDLNNVILTPHCVGHTIEGEAEFAPAMVENIERILRAELPLHCKNPEVETAWRARLARLDADEQIAA